MKAKQLRNCPQNEKANENSCCHDDQNIERHPSQQNFRKATAGRLNQDQRGNDRRRSVADTRNQTDERIESKLKLRVWKCDELVHHDRDPAKKRLEARALVLFFRREDFPLRLDHIGLRAHTIKVRPSRRSRELIAATRSRFSGVMVRDLFLSRCQKKRAAIFIGRKSRTNGTQERRW